MSGNRKLLILLFTTVLFNNVWSAGFPRGCEVSGFGYNGTNLVLNEKGDQSYYLIQNRDTRDIEMQRVQAPDEFMTPPLTARMSPANWSAFASDISNLHFQCFIQEETNKVRVDCRDVLEVCQYPRVKFALSNMGNYWVSVNKDQRQVINESTAKGIYLRW